MIRLRHKLFIYGLRIFDQALLIFALAIIVDQRTGIVRTNNLSRGFHWQSDSVGLAVLGIGWMLIFNVFVGYETNRFKTLTSQLGDVLKATSVAAFFLLVVSSIFSFARINNEVIVLLWCSTSLLAVMMRLLMRWFLMIVRRFGYNYRHLLIVGFNEQAVETINRINSHPILGYKLVGFISEKPKVVTGSSSSPDSRVLGELKDLKRVLETRSVDEMVICLPVTEYFPTISEIVRLAQELGIVVRLFPDASTAKVLTRFHLERFEGDYVVTLFREQMLLQLLGKRLLDLFGALLLITVLSPLMVLAAVAIKLTSKGPILFAQERIGMNKRRFTMFKFRSMFADAEARKAELSHLNEMDGPAFKMKKDPRVTPLGRFMRKTSIDELPQLFNVVSGQMSLVGPRPPLPAEVDRYEWLYRKRLCIKPGITCLWQISGRNEVSFKQWMEMDKQYIENWSLWLDVKILLKTIPAVLSRKGAS